MNSHGIFICSALPLWVLCVVPYIVHSRSFLTHYFLTLIPAAETPPERSHGKKQSFARVRTALNTPGSALDGPTILWPHATARSLLLAIAHDGWSAPVRLGPALCWRARPKLSKLTTPRAPIASSGGEIASSGGEIAHEALELHVALGEPDVARGDVGPLLIRARARVRVRNRVGVGGRVRVRMLVPSVSACDSATRSAWGKR